MEDIINRSKYRLLRQFFGYTEFREGQEEIINSIINDRDTLAIMPTGAGKSICYQLPALMKNGMTLIISPLKSLMTDQVLVLRKTGIKAAYINSSLSSDEINEILYNAANAQYKMIYVTPERLMREDFLCFARSVEISMIVIDEAHCVSEWGHDFRPQYRRINEFINELKKRPTVAAFSATATKQVREDIIISLGMNNPYELVTGFIRENLYFEIFKPANKFTKLCNILSQNEDKSIILYCLTRAIVEDLFERLSQKGFSVTKYHAGMIETERERNQFDFQNNIKNIMIATNAFGLGIHKSDISLVIHYNMPKSIENYYQEAGRAGRDGSDARCILLYSPSDVRINSFIIDKYTYNNTISAEKKRAYRKNEYARLAAVNHYCETSDCLRKTLLKYFGENITERCNKCTNCCSSFIKNSTR